MAKFEVGDDIERDGKSFTVLKGIRGTVFSDPAAEKKVKDLDDEYFHVGTFFGDQYGITRKFLLYDHGQNDLSNAFAIPNPVIGVAELKSIDSAARWFEIELDKANEMYPAIMELNNLGVLGVSSRTLPGKGICLKGDDGAINNWPEVELSLTVTPADPRTRFSDEEIVTLKSIMTRNNVPRVEKAVPQGPEGVDGPVGVEGSPQKEASLYMSINADLDSASIGDIVEAVTDAAVDTPVSEDSLMDKLLELLASAIDPWKAQIAILEAKIATLETAREDHAKSIKAVADSQVALKKDVAKSGGEWLKGLSAGAKSAALEILTNGSPAPKQEEIKQVTSTPAPTYGARVAFSNGYAPGSR